MTFVLVVDDDPAMRRTLSINLRARDYEVETAGDGRSALQVVDERMPDVSCSTSVCPTSTASRCSRSCGRSPRSR